VSSLRPPMPPPIRAAIKGSVGTDGANYCIRPVAYLQPAVSAVALQCQFGPTYARTCV